MKILIFSHEFPPAIGGAGTVARDLAMQESKSHRVHVLTSQNNFQAKNPGLENIPYSLYTINTSRSFWFWSYRKVLNFEDYDLIVLNDQVAILTAGINFSNSLLNKCVCYLHGSEPENIYKNLSFKRKMLFFKFFFRRALSCSRSIIAVSDYMKNKFIAVESNPKIREKIAIKYSEIDHSLFYYDVCPSLKKSLGIDSDKKIIMSASRIVLGKGYLEKLDLFKRLLMEDDRWIWIISGDGPDLDYIKNKSKQIGCFNSIRFVGSVDRTTLRYYYSISKVFWLLSNLDESYGLVYREAQSCNCPTIGRNRAGAVEAIEHGVNGFLIDDDKDFFFYIDKLKELEIGASAKSVM